MAYRVGRMEWEVDKKKGEILHFNESRYHPFADCDYLALRVENWERLSLNQVLTRYNERMKTSPYQKKKAEHLIKWLQGTPEYGS